MAYYFYTPEPEHWEPVGIYGNTVIWLEGRYHTKFMGPYKTKERAYLLFAARSEFWFSRGRDFKLVKLDGEINTIISDHSSQTYHGIISRKEFVQHLRR